ncbi:mannose-1-phosphate guanylyltransferase/mannose-6-phosphate isomerase [Thalassobaculum litoreum]|uniref:mannose-1-phosphate guanylyltransferase n=1 Tax=Thalassobaculum litoreum DSM 18839 TaxID=1123362 RepID=A0A8G2BIA4_9PROT|nr:mannose-1-phosphate guanylyltransferase/mannose-6-phosphate isomerase [Thalassobaculum litoreum]SDF41430.1 mannose-1-phosphate guanylyltransferase / mannose-6-phosphate isomerase [Thalassobaculum litoreum DSM 18839]
MTTIHPVLLSGGAGTRLWPLSRTAYPKQFLTLQGDHSLLQTTALRVCDPATFAPPLVVANTEHRFIVAEQLRAVGIEPAAILLEPAARGSAPAALAAALHLLAGDADAVLLLLAADHAMTRPQAFRDAVATALPAARGGRIVTFGISPSRPETSYGYILAGGAADRDVRPVSRFVEKPDVATAGTYLADGRYLWNSGNFLASAATLTREAARFTPDLLDGCRAALAGARSDLDFLRLGAEAYEGMRSVSIDVAIMERTETASVVACDPGWSDIGSFDALADALGRDADGNAAAGPVSQLDSHGTVAISHGPLIATLGLRNTVVVATEDAVLVADGDRVQEIRTVVDRLRAEGYGQVDGHAMVHRPWGSYRNLDMGDGFLVKQIRINPGGRLSLQTHAHRAEHWVVIEGRARVTLGPSADALDVVDLSAHQSIDIPLGWVHRLENATDVPVAIVEVQSGDMLSEEDIVRLDDVYGRSGSPR